LQPEIPAHTQAIQGDQKRLITIIDDLFDVVILLSPAGGTILFKLSLNKEEVRITAQNRSAIIPAGSSESFLEWLGRNLQEEAGLGGVGIALYRSYLTAELLGGKMDLETPTEGGVSITVRFPYKKFELSLK
jgi:signal transduction histidine kinase